MTTIDTATRVLATRPFAPGPQPISGDSVIELAAAAADAGFDGLILWSQHYVWAVADGMPPGDFIDRHLELGVAIASVEAAVEWSHLDRGPIAEVTVPVLDVAQRCGATSVIAAATTAAPMSLTEVASRLACVCDLAAERNLRVSFEYLPLGPVPDLRTTLDLLDAVDRDNFGLVLDTWHWHFQAGGPDLGSLALLPSDRIHMVHLNDAPPDPPDDLRLAARSARLAPGDGVIDYDPMIDTLQKMGADPLIAVEVFSTEVANAGADRMARRLFEAANGVMDGRLGWGRHPH